MITRAENAPAQTVKRAVATAARAIPSEPAPAAPEPEDSVNLFSGFGVFFKALGMVSGIEGAQQIGDRMIQGPSARRLPVKQGLDLDRYLAGPGKHVEGHRN